MSLPELYVIYGSQTGNSESIAKELSDLLEKKNIENKLMTLNAFKSIPPPANGQSCFLVLVCSTTGNGDCPENADSWWRSTKLRSAPKDKFANCQYLVLALGDTNYSKFCFMGKAIDKRIAELGGIRAAPLECVDEATGLEEGVEKWKASTLALLEKVFLAAPPSQPSPEEAEGEKKGEQEPDDFEGKPLIKRKSSQRDHEDVLNKLLCTIPEGLQPLQPFIDQLQLHQFVANQSLEESGRERVRKQENVPCIVQPGSNADDGQVEAKGLDRDSSHPFWCAQNPFSAKVLEAGWLTDEKASQESLEETFEWGQSKRVVYCRLSLQDSNISYNPGDSLGILAPNPPYAVAIILRRLNEALLAAGEKDLLSGEDTRVLLPGHSKPQSLHDVLAYSYDLMSVPKKTTMKGLARFCVDESERRGLLALASREAESKQLWSHFVEQQRIGVAELLLLFPSCLPTLAQLLALLPPAVPRYYSIASSPLSNPQSVSIAFSVVRYTCEITDPLGHLQGAIRRSGVATLYLEHNLRGLLHPERYPQASVNSVRVFHRPSTFFRLPCSAGIPLVLIGPGTGVAPFLSFLDHRSHQQRRRSNEGSTGLWRGGFELDDEDLPVERNSIENFISSQTPGPIHLFYGCRNHGDFLFKEDLERYSDYGVLTSLDVAMSRLTPDKIYVTHKLRERGSEIADLVVNRGAHVYICGDGNKMAKDVIAALKEAVAQFNGCSEESAAQIVTEMQQRHRLLLDIWSA
eukprot:scaffold5082_cov195-Ochromonas_danica.AAC.7